ncbi:MAG TPA: aminotransferase class V-fold PLP-dependent enzyme [Holophagaceae bacterium]|nr:aminotransferase class V-fold PLP-dependent enzyme [Holophagaceae bacterium]
MIYLDHNATTAVDPEVLAAMLPWFAERPGNAGSAHALGHLAEAAVNRARDQVAALLSCAPAELVFTSGATEALNHAIRGVVEAFPAKRHMVISAVEHPAVQALAAWLPSQGVEVSVAPVDGEGRLDLEALEALIRPDTALVAVMAANNESGVLNPLDEVGARVHAKGSLLLVDATQAVGKVPVSVAQGPADLLCLSAHKFHGPKGVGALYLRRGLRLKPLLLGGGQERGRRGGTENVPGLVGLGAAAALASERLGYLTCVAELRDHLEATLLAAVPRLKVLGQGAPRLPNTSLLAFEGVEGEALLLKLDRAGICVSTGSACSTGHKEPSHVLRAMGVDPAYAKGTLRVSLGRTTTAVEVETLEDLLPGVVAELRGAGTFSR